MHGTGAMEPRMTLLLHQHRRSLPSRSRISGAVLGLLLCAAPSVCAAVGGPSSAGKPVTNDTRVSPLLKVAQLGESTVPTIPPMPDPSDFRLPTGRPLALGDALKTAVEHNHDIALQELNVALYHTIFRGQWGVYDASLDVSVNRNRLEFVGYSKTYGYDILQDNTNDLLNIGASKRWTTGTELGLSLDTVRYDSTFAFATAPDQKSNSAGYQSTFGFTLDQNLLDGFGVKVGTAAIRGAEADWDRETQLFASKVQSVLGDVQKAYWELAYAAEEVRIRRYSRALAERQLEITRARVRAGQRAELELLQVEEQLAAAEEVLIQAEDTFWIAEAALRRLLDLPQGEDRHLQPVSLPAPTQSTVSVDEAFARAKQKNPSLAAQRERVRSLELAVLVPRNALLPDLNLSASLGRWGNGADMVESLKSLTDDSSLSWSVGLNLKAPLPNRTARSALQQAALAVKRAKTTLAQQEAALSEQILVAVRRLQSTKRRLRWSARRLELAQAKLKAEEQRYQVGFSTLQDVLRFQEDLEEAALTDARARADGLNAVVDLELLEGRLPEALQIQEMIEERLRPGGRG